MKPSTRPSFVRASASWLVLLALVLAGIGGATANAAGGSVTLTASSDFATGVAACAPDAPFFFTPTNLIITEDGTGATDPNRGELAIKANGVEDYFLSGPLDTTKWTSGNYGGTPTIGVSGSKATITTDGATRGGYIESASPVAVYGTLEGDVTFSAGRSEHFGFASDAFSSDQYAIFSTLDGSGNLYARTNNNGGEQQTNLGPIPAGPVRLKIVWTAGAPTGDTLTYYLNGTSVATHTVDLNYGAGVLHPILSNDAATALPLSMDWARYTPETQPYVVAPTQNQSTTYFSCTFDAGSTVFWNNATVDSTTPAGTSISVDLQASNTYPIPSGASYIAVPSGIIANPPQARYAKLRVRMTSDGTATPKLKAVTLNYGAQAQLPTVSIGNAQVTEGNSGTTNAAFTISLSAASTDPVTVNYATSAGPAPAATAGVDYTTTSGTATIPAGQTSVQVTVPVKGDTTYEPDEKFTVTLSNPTNAALGTATGTGTIVNDDAQPALSVADASLAEGNSGQKNMAFTVELSNPSSQEVTVNYATADGTAKAGADYTSASGSLTFAAGETSKTVTVAITGDTAVEGNETFTLTLSSPTNATIARATATGTILDDDVPPTISVADVSLAEGNSGQKNMVFTVQLSNPSSQEVTVNYATADGTAKAGADYTSASGSLTFAAGETSKTVTVAITGDTAVEGNETFTLTLSNPTNATIARATATGTIVDDDSPADPRPFKIYVPITTNGN